VSGRPRCSVYIAASVDGFIARPDGGLDWLEVVQAEGEDYGYAAFMASVDALVMGRGTYDVVAGLETWPYAGKRCVVLTHRPPERPCADETFFTGPVAELAARLGAEGVGHVYVDGGDVIRQWLAAGLLDDLTISWIPTVLGAGIPLFGALLAETPLRLVESRSWPTGLVQARYALGATGR